MKVMTGKNMIMGICVVGVVALGPICSGCGADNNCETGLQIKACSEPADCVLVCRGCCSPGTFDAVNRDCADRWRELNGYPGSQICPAVYFAPPDVFCENNQCVARYAGSV